MPWRAGSGKALSSCHFHKNYKRRSTSTTGTVTFQHLFLNCLKAHSDCARRRAMPLKGKSRQFLLAEWEHGTEPASTPYPPPPLPVPFSFPFPPSSPFRTLPLLTPYFHASFCIGGSGSITAGKCFEVIDALMSVLTRFGQRNCTSKTVNSSKL
jgi:hypothetical protein